MNKSYKRHNKMLPHRRVYLKFIDAFECKNVEKSNPVDINATYKADSWHVNDVLSCKWMYFRMFKLKCYYAPRYKKWPLYIEI